MPFLKDVDRAKYDKHIDKLLEQLSIAAEDGKENPHATYIVYRLLMEGLEFGDDIEKMFAAYGVLEATRMNLDRYFSSVEQSIESKRWLRRNGSR
jgi:hypothetical protein